MTETSADIFEKKPVMTREGIKYILYSLILLIAELIAAIAIILSNQFGNTSAVVGLSCVSGILSFIWIIMLILGSLKLMYGKDEVKNKIHIRNSKIVVAFSILVIILIVVSFVYSFLSLWTIVYKIFSISDNNVTLENSEVRQIILGFKGMLVVQLAISFVESIIIGSIYFLAIKALVRKTLLITLAFSIIIASSIASLLTSTFIISASVDEMVKGLPNTNNSSELRKYLNNTITKIENLQILSNLPMSIAVSGYIIFLIEYIRVKRNIDMLVDEIESRGEVQLQDKISYSSPSGIEENYLQKARCPFCEYEFEIAKSLIQHDIQCPRCGANFRIVEK